MMATATSDDLAHYHHAMRVLMHAGALDEFNKYDTIVEKAKKSSEAAGKQILDADKTAHSVSEMIEGYKKEGFSSVVGSVKSFFGFREKNLQASHFLENKSHAFDFDILSVVKNISKAKDTQKKVRF